MTSRDNRWQMAMGAITGAIVADARMHSTSIWPATSIAAVSHAEALLAGTPLPIDLTPVEAVPAAVGSALAAPLLADGSTVALFDTIRGTLETGVVGDSPDPTVAKASDLAAALPFVEAVDTADSHELAVLVGALSGLSGGVGAIPARLACGIVAPDGRRGRRYLSGLTLRLLGQERPQWYDPRRRRGPKEVLPKLWLSNLYGVSRFVDAHPEGLVLSLCDDEGSVAATAEHLTFHIEDAPNSDANPNLQVVLDDVLGEIQNARSADRPVLLHCRHGASRTGLVLRLILVDELGLDADAALMEAQCIWPHTSTWNKRWNAEVERRAATKTQKGV